MNVCDQYDGTADPFEGDRTIMWRSLPVGAQVTTATITVTPVAPPGGNLFEEIISFPISPGILDAMSASQGSLGTTKDGGSGFVEVDFHKRRTLAAVTGDSLSGANLQVDLGGLYVEINDKGAIESPGDAAFPVPNDGLLPGLTVSKFKLTQTVSTPDVSSVTIRSVPTNLSLRLGDLRPFWTVTGELSTSAKSPDFSSVLQKFLASAKVEGGYLLAPLVVHSDTLARLQIEIDVKFVNQASILPVGLSEAVLAFDFSTQPSADPHILSIGLPAGAKILPGQTSLEVLGAFDDTRIVPGVGVPLGASLASYTVGISPYESQAQSISSNQGFAAVSVDLFLAALSPSAQLSLDLRADFNGKPNNVSLLPEPASFTLALNPHKDPGWANVPLPQPFNFESGATYWLVLASLEGDCEWVVQAASQGVAGMQHTVDGGLSWGQAGATGISGQVAAAFRLRSKPGSFQLPVQLRVGSEPVSLAIYRPLAQVNFVLNAPQFADAFNQYLLKRVPPPLPEGEHLTNGSFEKWKVIGDTLGEPYRIPLDVMTFSAMAVSPDGRWLYVGVSDGSRSVIKIIDSLCESGVRAEIELRTEFRTLAMVVHPSGAGAYVITSETLHVLDLQLRVEIARLSLQHLTRVAGVTGVAFGPNLALSPDGGELYLSIGGIVVAVRTAALDFLKRHLRPLLKQDTRSLLFSPNTAAGSLALMALTPDGSRLFLAAPESSTIRIMDTASFVLEADSIELGNHPVSIDFTPDGSLGIVATAENNTATLVDTVTGVVVESANLSAKPLAVAASSDGTRAYMLVSEWLEEESATAILPRFMNLKQLSITILPARLESNAAIAVSPQGDRVYLNAGGTLIALPLGSRSPTDWVVTSSNPAITGEVTPVCFPQDSAFDRGLEFGRRPRYELVPNVAATRLSQIVGAVPSCSFEFSFWAVSDGPSAMAELFWLDQHDNPLKKESMPIEEQPGGSAMRLWQRAPRAVSTGELRPILHRSRVTSPAGTEQVEVRFTVPARVRVVLASASLSATSEAVVNSDLQILQRGVPAGWNLATQAVRGVSFIPAGKSIQFVNSSIADAELIQTTELTQTGQFTFEFLGRIVETRAPKDNAQLELKWLKADGSLSAPSIRLQILTTGFSRYLAGGMATSATTQVEIRLKVPTGVTLEISKISLITLASSLVPVTFLAEAPGELRVSSSAVSYERIPVPPPIVTSDKLALSTPSGKQLGARSNQQIYCPRCQKLVTQATTTVGSALLQRCPECGSQLLPDEETFAAEIPAMQSPTLPAHGRKIRAFARPAPERLKPPLRTLARVTTRAAAGKTKPAKRGRRSPRAPAESDK